MASDLKGTPASYLKGDCPVNSSLMFQQYMHKHDN